MSAIDRVEDELIQCGCEPIRRNNHIDSRCPSHGDRHASLSVDGVEGKVLVKCHAGCTSSDVVTALGLNLSDLYDKKERPPTNKGAKIEVSYDYVDEFGALIYQAVRYSPKEFKQRQPNNAGGWTWNLKGVRRVPYRLPELILAVKSGELILVVEGEKDADRLATEGFAATCNSGGAGKFLAEFAHYFKGARVVILPDNDEPGANHARQVRDLLSGVANETQIVNLPGLPDHGDISDWFEAGGSAAQLIDLINATQLLSDFPDFEEVDYAPSPELIEIEGDHLNSNRFLDEHGKDLRYSPELHRWFVWNGAWWDEDLLEVVRERARQTIDNLRLWTLEASDVEEFVRRAKHYRASARSNRIEGMLALARSLPGIVVGVRDLDKYPHLVACRNGTVDLRTGELLPSERDLLLTRGVDVDHAPDALSEEFESFLSTIFSGNTEVIEYVQRLFGYSFTGEIGEHVLAIFYGDGANGKTQLLNAVMSVMGGHAALAPDGLLIQSKSTPHDERIAALRGRRLVVSSELEDDSRLAEALVKQLTGGDRLSARYLYGQRFEFEPTHTLVLVTNHLPHVSGTDRAIWRRLKIVPFQVVIPANERIQDYGKRLAQKYASAILAWLVQGAVSWYGTGLGEPEIVSREVEAFRAGEDVFAQFLDDCTMSAAGPTPVKVLLAAWSAWCKPKGLRVGRNQDFSRRLEEHGFRIEPNQNAMFVRGITLRRPAALFEDDLS